jgi:hypothetical protein
MRPEVVAQVLGVACRAISDYLVHTTGLARGSAMTGAATPDDPRARVNPNCSLRLGF